MDLCDQLIPIKEKGFAYHQTEYDQENIEADKDGADKPGRMLDETGKDYAAVKPLFLFQFDGQALALMKATSMPAKKMIISHAITIQIRVLVLIMQTTNIP